MPGSSALVRVTVTYVALVVDGNQRGIDQVSERTRTGTAMLRAVMAPLLFVLVAVGGGIVDAQLIERLDLSFGKQAEGAHHLGETLVKPEERSLRVKQLKPCTEETHSREAHAHAHAPPHTHGRTREIHTVRVSWAGRI